MGTEEYGVGYSTAPVKMKKVKKTPEQREILEATYEGERYPTDVIRAQLVAQTGLTDKQLQMWFVHRRRKDRIADMAGELGPKDTGDDFDEEAEDEGTAKHGRKGNQRVSEPDEGPPRTLVAEKYRSQRLIGSGKKGVVENDYGIDDEDDDEERPIAYLGRAKALGSQMSLARKKIKGASSSARDRDAGGQALLGQTRRKNTGQEDAAALKATKEAIEAMVAKMPEPLRPDGPPIGVVFDPLPHNSFFVSPDVGNEGAPFQGVEGRSKYDPSVSSSGHMAANKLGNAARSTGSKHIAPGSRRPMLPVTISMGRSSTGRGGTVGRAGKGGSGGHMSIRVGQKSGITGNGFKGVGRGRGRFFGKGRGEKSTAITEELDQEEARHRTLLAKAVEDDFVKEIEMHEAALRELTLRRQEAIEEKLKDYKVQEKSKLERKRKLDESRLHKEQEAVDKKLKRDSEREMVAKRKREEFIRKEQEKQEREQRREVERIAKERFKEEERLEKEKKREAARCERERAKEVERLEKERVREKLRQDREAAREKERHERKLARRLAREATELIDDEELELIEAVQKVKEAARKADAKARGPDLDVKLDEDEDAEEDEVESEAQLAEAQQVVLQRKFPPQSVIMREPLDCAPWLQSASNTGDLYMVWCFVSKFSDKLGLWMFSLEELAQALHDPDSRLLREVHVALLKVVLKDTRGSSQVMTSDSLYPASPPVMQEAAAWGFQVKHWRKHVNGLTWPEVLRQYALAAGLGPRRRQRVKLDADGEDEDSRELDLNSEAVVEQLSNGGAAEAAARAVLDRRRQLGASRKLTSKLTPGTVKYAAFYVLAVEGSGGLTVPQIAEKIQTSGLRDLSTSRTPEATIAGALSRDGLFLKLAPSTYCVKAQYRKDPADAENVMRAAREEVEALGGNKVVDEEEEEDGDGDVEEEEGEGEEEGNEEVEVPMKDGNNPQVSVHSAVEGDTQVLTIMERRSQVARNTESNAQTFPREDSARIESSYAEVDDESVRVLEKYAAGASRENSKQQDEDMRELAAEVETPLPSATLDGPLHVKDMAVTTVQGTAACNSQTAGESSGPGAVLTEKKYLHGLGERPKGSDVAQIEEDGQEKEQQGREEEMEEWIEEQVEEGQVGESWVQALAEGEYADLSVEEKLKALVALVHAANESNLIRNAIEERHEMACALRRQMWFESHAEKRRHREQEAARLHPSSAAHAPEASSASQATANSKGAGSSLRGSNAGASDLTPDRTPPHSSQGGAGQSDAGIVGLATSSAKASPGTEGGGIVNADSLAAETKLRAMQTSIAIRADDLYGIRERPLGKDRRHNRYWQLHPYGATWQTPGHARIFFENYPDGDWKVIDSEESLDNLMASLDTRGAREAVLYASLKHQEASFKRAFRAERGCEQRVQPKEQKQEVGGALPPGADSQETPMPSSLAVVKAEAADAGGDTSQQASMAAGASPIGPRTPGGPEVTPACMTIKEAGEGDAAERLRQLQQAEDVEDCLARVPLRAAAVLLEQEQAATGNPSPRQPPASGDPAAGEGLTAAEASRRLLHVAAAADNVGVNIEDGNLVMASGSTSMQLEEALLDSTPPTLKALKAILMDIRLALPEEAVDPLWLEKDAATWHNLVKSAVQPGELLLALAQLEDAVMRECLQPSFRTTSETLQQLPAPKPPSTSQQQVGEDDARISPGVLPWVPHTAAAVALRALAFDAALAYRPEEVGTWEEEEEDELVLEANDPRAVRLPDLMSRLPPRPQPLKPESESSEEEVEEEPAGAGTVATGAGRSSFLRGGRGGRGRARGALRKAVPRMAEPEPPPLPEESNLVARSMDKASRRGRGRGAPGWSRAKRGPGRLAWNKEKERAAEAEDAVPEKSRQRTGGQVGARRGSSARSSQEEEEAPRPHRGRRQAVNGGPGFVSSRRSSLATAPGASSQEKPKKRQSASAPGREMYSSEEDLEERMLSAAEDHARRERLKFASSGEEGEGHDADEEEEEVQEDGDEEDIEDEEELEGEEIEEGDEGAAGGEDNAVDDELEYDKDDISDGVSGSLVDEEGYSDEEEEGAEI